MNSLPAAPPMPEQQDVAQQPPHPVLTINARGELVGDLSNIPAEVLEKLRTPEAQEQLRATYRKQFGSGRRVIAQATHREPKEEQRDFTHLCPPGMSSKEFRKVRRKFLHKQTKVVLKEKTRR